MSRKHVAWVGVGLTLTMAIASPVYADDTELLVATPNSTGADKPNILFILDSSGSMKTIEKTQEPYNASFNYPGGCLADRYYWTSKNNTPECNKKNKKHIDKARFLCAQGVATRSSVSSA